MNAARELELLYHQMNTAVKHAKHCNGCYSCSR